MTRNKLPPIPRAGALLAALGFIIIVGYSFYAALPYLEGPSLSVHETTQNGLTTVSGTTARVSFLSIDDAPVPLSVDGSFSAERAYPAGYTAIQVTVRDRFGRSLTKTVSFVNNVTP